MSTERRDQVGLWYQDGLRFECQRCGRCCSGEPGRVRVSDPEICVLAARVGLEEPEFRRRYTRRTRGPEVLLVEKRNRDCVFFDPGRGCVVYEDRPRQCRTWPFWSATLESRENWQAQAEDCRGMNCGPLHSADEIRSIGESDGISKP
jgi:Fe-S-cluster containining protein